MRSIIIIFTLALSSVVAVAQDTVSINTFSQLFGKNWSGTLTYLDYSTNEEASIPVTMTVEPLDDETLIFSFEYPGENSANSKGEVKIGKNGQSINGQKVIAVESLPGGNTEIVTMEKGKDNGKSALMTYTYVIGPKLYASEKFVRYDGEDQAFFRNGYAMTSVDQ